MVDVSLHIRLHSVLRASVCKFGTAKYVAYLSVRYGQGGGSAGGQPQKQKVYFKSAKTQQLYFYSYLLDAVYLVAIYCY